LERHRDEGQDAGTSLYAGHLCTEKLAFDSYHSCIETHWHSLVFPSLFLLSYIHQ
jgi:hypothetical protein